MRRLFVQFNQFAIGPESDPASFLELFAVIFDDVRKRGQTTKKRFEVPPGPLLAWAVQRPPKPAELERDAASATPPRDWPARLRSQWAALRGGLFLDAVALAGRHAARFDIRDGRQICRLLAGVAQTFTTECEQLRRHNVELAQKYLAPALRKLSDTLGVDVAVARPATRQRSPLLAQYDNRNDEIGASLRAADLTLWYASYVGPHYAAKGQNQDASAALADGPNLFFSLADGVSTSVGSRFAAAVVAATYCQAAREAVAERGRPDLACAKNAVCAAQRSLEDLLSEVLERWSTEDFSELHEGLLRPNAEIFLRNTLTRKNRRVGSAFATTLIGGLLAPGVRPDEITGYLVRLGDGIVEQVDANGNVKSLFGMDRKEAAISSFVAPGPLGRAAVDRVESISVALAPGDCLLMSSDGLARGHNLPVWRKLQEVDDGARPSPEPRDNLARALLEKAAEAADAAYRHDPRTDLFNDNLSLVLVKRAQR